MSQDIKPCPLCGGMAKMKRTKKIISPKQNLYGDFFFSSFAMEITCEPCFLHMGVAVDAEHKTEKDALNDYEHFTNTVINMWNRRDGV